MERLFGAMEDKVNEPSFLVLTPAWAWTMSDRPVVPRVERTFL
jgi:hypothetical protein